MVTGFTQLCFLEFLSMIKATPYVFTSFLSDSRPLPLFLLIILHKMQRMTIC
jgi:hypothetical protein